MKKIRIGSGAGFANDRLEPALVLLEKGNLDYICLECLAERTIAIAQQEKNLNPLKGYNNSLEYRMEKLLPLAYEKKVKIVSNMGAANVEKAVEKIVEIAERHNLKGLKVVGIVGDDVFEKLERYNDFPILETGGKLGDLKNKVAANAYIGCEPMVEALKKGADIVITGRSSDPSIFVAPLVYEFGWSLDDYDLLGKGTLVGHLLECSDQVSGGNFAVPGKKEVPDLWKIGFPIAEVSENGEAIISKVEGTGGRIDNHTCTEQLLYEIHNPANYITPDCIADFSKVTFENIGTNLVKVAGGTGKPKTSTYKVSVGYKDGYIGSAYLSFGGAKCFDRAVLAAETLQKIMEYNKVDAEEMQISLIGYNSLFPLDYEKGFPEAKEVRMRIAARVKDKAVLTRIADEVDALTIGGPSGGGGLERFSKELVAILSFLIPREDIKFSYICKEVQ